MKNKAYDSPVIDILVLSNADVVKTSGELEAVPLGAQEWNFDWFKDE